MKNFGSLAVTLYTGSTSLVSKTEHQKLFLSISKVKTEFL